MVTTRSSSHVEPQKPISQNLGLSPPLENFKTAVLNSASKTLNRPLTDDEIVRIEDDITAKAAVLLHTPEHPPYSSMIHQALEQLHEEGGSSEESISNFIIKEFPDLPWAHSAFLKHNLRILCDSEEIFLNSENRYLLVDENFPIAANCESDKPNTELKKRRGRPRKRVNKLEKKMETIYDQQNKVEELDGTSEVLEELKQRTVKNKFQLPKDEKEMEQVGSESLPLADVEKDRQMLDGSGTSDSSETLIDYVKNVKITSGRELRSAAKNKTEPDEVASTTALILELAQPKSRPQEPVRGRSRGRPRKINSSEERKSEKLQNQQPPKRRGRPRKVDS